MGGPVYRSIISMEPPLPPPRWPALAPPHQFTTGVSVNLSLPNLLGARGSDAGHTSAHELSTLVLRQCS